MSKRLLISAAIILFLSIIPLYGESSDNDGDIPVEKIEFPQWLHDLRRGEIIFFGSLPFTILMSTIGYQAVDYFGAIANGQENVVWGNLTNNDRKNVLYITVGLSISIAVTDFILGKLFDEEQ